MEDIYLKGFSNREWCSDKVHLKSYFQEFSKELSIISNNKNKLKSELEILQLFVPQANQLTQEEFTSLAHECSGTHLTIFNKDELLKKSLSDEDEETGTSKKQEECKEANNKEKSASKVKKNRIKYEKSNSSRRDIAVDTNVRNGVRDLDPRIHFKVLFRIHEPYTHNLGENNRPGRCTQEIAVLGHQPLTMLRDSIMCEADFQDIRGDISENPDSPVTTRALDRYLSNMFYFDNTFYVDKRHKNHLDYSEPIRKWGLSRNIDLGSSVSMESVKVEDLKIRFGYPYLYMHQGSCEHIVFISDARLLSSKDNLHSLDYPLPTKTSHANMLYCMLCSRLPAKWIVTDCEELAHNPTYECKDCFKLYHYINGKKVGQFKAYIYSQRSVLL